MKILHFIETGGPGGAEQVFLTYVKTLRDMNIEVLAVTLREGWLTTRLDEEKIERRLLTSKKSRIQLVFLLYSLIKSERIDLVHSHLLDSNFYCSIAATLANVPHIGTEHGDIHHLRKKRMAAYKTRLTSFFTSHIFAVSLFSKNALIKSGMSKRKVSVLPNPFDFTTDKTKRIPRETRMNYLGLSDQSPDTWIWIHVANLRQVKDQTSLLEGFAKSTSRKEHPQKLILVGDGSLRNELEKKAFSLGISEDVLFLGFRNDIQELLSLADGFILSSLSEALPISILEAARAKLVLLSSSVGGIPEIITDSETGFLFPPLSPDSIAGKIDYVITHKEKARITAENAYTTLSRRLNSDVIMEEALGRYHSLLKKERPSGDS
jgi:glycosyltransferase involved in cell wall biosynthesis